MIKETDVLNLCKSRSYFKISFKSLKIFNIFINNYDANKTFIRSRIVN